MEELRRLWDEHRAEPFPDSIDKGEDYGGVELVMLDADIAGLVSSFLDSRRLDDHKRAIVRACRRDYDLAHSSIPAEAAAYFERLRRMLDLLPD